MFERLRRLTQAHKRLGVAVANDAWAACDGDETKFLAMVKEDKRTTAISPALIYLFIQLALAVFQYYKNKKAPAHSVESVDDTIVACARYWEG